MIYNLINININSIKYQVAVDTFHSFIYFGKYHYNYLFKLQTLLSGFNFHPLRNTGTNKLCLLFHHNV